MGNRTRCLIAAAASIAADLTAGQVEVLHAHAEQRPAVDILAILVEHGHLVPGQGGGDLCILRAQQRNAAAARLPALELEGIDDAPVLLKHGAVDAQASSYFGVQPTARALPVQRRLILQKVDAIGDDNVIRSGDAESAAETTRHAQPQRRPGRIAAVGGKAEIDEMRARAIDDSAAAAEADHSRRAGQVVFDAAALQHGPRRIEQVDAATSAAPTAAGDIVEDTEIHKMDRARRRRRHKDAAAQTSAGEAGGIVLDLHLLQMQPTGGYVHSTKPTARAQSCAAGDIRPRVLAQQAAAQVQAGPAHIDRAAAVSHAAGCRRRRRRHDACLRGQSIQAGQDARQGSFPAGQVSLDGQLLEVRARLGSRSSRIEG